MRLNVRYLHGQRGSRGSMLVLALFVIVVMAFLGVALTKLLSTASEAVSYEVLGQRALNAAKAGIECQLAVTFPLSDPQPAYCVSPASYSFGDVPGLENCAYNTSVVSKVVQDDLIIKNYYQFTSTGQCIVGKIVVSRTLYIDAML
ncbi:MAG: MSHA biogenesis protein MshP [Paraglaciecola sp.]|uniref:MSHA biogenesis protein MshP n=1 Tax=Paraglaciecola sp. TaxID=1920173 RepID=UPI00273ECEC7|nr:MSHA biogenesis protein MshP [Paraglaciecola sp.]MDP5029678.1 MSHA biogenesis protein MshP [Paraglaciecola sp.]MDP5040624.1 MSHA biogenesis protein MshP [Paraglaciecola sp.]MDP5131594.1 MSHA biogenesis protein MshP [Paraglaciecola sp.]